MVQAELLSIFEPLRKMMNELTDHLFKIFHKNLQKVQIFQKSLVSHSFFRILMKCKILWEKKTSRFPIIMLRHTGSTSGFSLGTSDLSKEILGFEIF